MSGYYANQVGIFPLSPTLFFPSSKLDSFACAENEKWAAAKQQGGKMMYSFRSTKLSDNEEMKTFDLVEHCSFHKPSRARAWSVLYAVFTEHTFAVLLP